MDFTNVEVITIHLHNFNEYDTPCVDHDKPDIIDITERFLIVSYRREDGSIKRYFYNIDHVARFSFVYKRT